MAIPTDPAKRAAYHARQAVNSANYRARVKAERLGVQPPTHARRQQPAHYRPPRVSGIVERAQASTAKQRQARATLINSLTNINNPKVKLRPGEQTERAAPIRKTRRGQQRQAADIRANAAAQRLQDVGRDRKQRLVSELESGPQADRLKETMSKSQQRKFQKYMERIAAGSQQSVAILFEYAGGQGDFSSAFDRLLGSPESRDVEEGLSKLKQLAKRAEKAAVAYSPKAIGRVTV